MQLLVTQQGHHQQIRIGMVVVAVAAATVLPVVCAVLVIACVCCCFSFFLSVVSSSFEKVWAKNGESKRKNTAKYVPIIPRFVRKCKYRDDINMSNKAILTFPDTVSIHKFSTQSTFFPVEIDQETRNPADF